MKTTSKLTIDQAKEVWNSYLGNNDRIPTASFEWYNTWISVHQEEWQPYLLSVDKLTIAPFVRKNDLIKFTQSYTDFNDLIGDKNEEIWLSLLEFIRQDGVRKIEFENIPENSPTTLFFKDYVARNQNGTVIPAKTTPFLVLSNTFEEYISQPSIKSKRRKYNKFQREYPNLKIIKSATPEKDIDFLIGLLEKDSHKNASLLPQKISFFREIASSCRKNVWIHILSLEGKIISVLYMFINPTSVMLYNSAFDREAYPNAGTYLILDAIKRSIEDGYKEFNFLIGKESYKYELGAKDAPLYSVFINL